MAFTDIMGQYLTSRMDRATQPFTDPEAYLRQRLLDDEEERRRQEREEAARLAAEQAQAQQQAVEQAQQSQLQTAAPGQTVTQIPAGMAMPNPYGSAIAQGQSTEGPAPSMGGPVAPDQDQANIEEQRRLQQAEMEQAQAAQQPIAAVMPEQPVTMPTLPQPGPGVQVAGPTQMPPAPAPVQAVAPAAPAPAPAPMAAVAPVAAPAPAPAPAAAPAPSMGERMAQAASRLTAGAGITTPQAAEQAAIATEAVVAPAPMDQTLLDARNEKDPVKRRQAYAQILSSNPSEATRNLTLRFAGEEYLKEQKLAEAEREIESLSPTDLARYMTGKQKEGSYIKAILFSRLGLNALAQKEMELIEPSLTMSTMIDDKGNRYAVETRANGQITRAFDSQGRAVPQKEIAKLQAAGGTLKGVEVGTQVFKDPTGKVPGSFVLERRPGGSVYREVGTNAIATPEQSRVLNAVGVQGTLADQRSRLIQEMNIKLQGKAGEEAMAIQRNYNQQLVAAGFPPLQPSETPIIAPQIGGVAAPAPQAAPAQPAAPAPQAAPAQPAAPGVAPTAAPAPQAAPGVAPAPAVQPGAATRPGAAPGVGVGRPVVGAGMGGRPTGTQLDLAKTAGEAEIQRRKEIAVAEQRPPAEARGKLDAKDINNQAFADSTYGLIQPIADLVKQSTGSGIGARVDSLVALFGGSTQGAQAIAALKPLTYPLLANVPRFEGPQSDYDVKVYQQAAGDFANAELPIATRMAALQGMITLLKKYDKAGKNDWTFGEGQQPGQIRIIKREKVR